MHVMFQALRTDTHLLVEWLWGRKTSAPEDVTHKIQIRGRGREKIPRENMFQGEYNIKWSLKESLLTKRLFFNFE